MADLGISGKRVRKKPKYLRDDEEEDEEGSVIAFSYLLLNNFHRNTITILFVGEANFHIYFK
mgnify:CR=1 FL=1